MCLILFAILPDQQHQLIVAANRDEQYSRPTLKADFWEKDPNVLAGIDLQAGGTWLGVTKSARFAAVTNFAEVAPEPLPPRSRGELTSDFLLSDVDCRGYLEQVDQVADEYRGFNLLLSDGQSTYYYSNRAREIKQLEPGFYGLSNQLLDCHWPKVNSARDELEALSTNQFNAGQMFTLLAERGDEIPHSARFIVGDTYGTSASTVVKITHDKIDFEEKNFKVGGVFSSARQFQINRY